VRINEDERSPGDETVTVYSPTADWTNIKSSISVSPNELRRTLTENESEVTPVSKVAVPSSAGTRVELPLPRASLFGKPETVVLISRRKLAPSWSTSSCPMKLLPPSITKATNGSMISVRFEGYDVRRLYTLLLNLFQGQKEKEKKVR
jgi:hypothetical protein